jgi:nitrogenase iron protein NifH
MSKRIAIYGKGGIGKSTIASNLTAVLGWQGRRVLQIGCDPKHDSTLLLTAEPIKPILDMDERELRDRRAKVVRKGIYGIDCVEIGGPEPGIGCAGRGILRGIDLLESLGVFDQDYDFVVFDVLGDVVCGGFFAPLKKYTDEMYIVTSGEFNSLFAANNLCRGYANNALGHVTMGGIIGNCRGNPNEKKVISEFARATGAPLVGMLPKEELVERCTFEHVPLVARDPKHSVTAAIADIAARLERNAGVREVSFFQLERLREFYCSIRGGEALGYQNARSSLSSRPETT